MEVSRTALIAGQKARKRVSAESHSSPILIVSVIASLIARNLALTAAHCVAKNPVADQHILATYRINQTGPTSSHGGNEYPILKIIMYPDYMPLDNYSDIAVLVLGAPTIYGGKQPVWIPINKDSAIPALGSTVKVMGFGSLYNSSGPYPQVFNILLDYGQAPTIRLIVVPNLICRNCPKLMFKLAPGARALTNPVSFVLAAQITTRAAGTRAALLYSRSAGNGFKLAWCNADPVIPADQTATTLSEFTHESAILLHGLIRLLRRIRRHPRTRGGLTCY